MREHIRRVMAGVFATPVEDLSDDSSIDDVVEWDSMRHIELMLELEMEFGVSIPMVVMLELLSLEAIEDYLREQGAKSPG